FPVTVLGPQRFAYSQAGPAEAGIVTPMFTVATGPNTLAQQRAAHMYTIESTTADTHAILTQPGAHHYVWHDGEVATTNTSAGQGPFKIVNNHLRGGASTLHFGGTPPSVPGLVPSDIEIRLNTVDLDPNWFSLSHCGLTGSRNWMLSDRLDIRNARRVVIEGN